MNQKQGSQRSIHAYCVARSEAQRSTLIRPGLGQRGPAGGDRNRNATRKKFRNPKHLQGKRARSWSSARDQGK